MDNLTHTAVGFLLSRAGLNRLHARATAILLIAANVPDADIVCAVAGREFYFQQHRGITHALIAMPVMALLPVLIVRLLCRRDHAFSWKTGWLISLVGVASHLALDYTNPYGIRLWLPFHDTWPALNATSVVDLWIWLMLAFAVFWPMLSRLVASEIGGPKKPAGRGLAIAALLFLPIYNSARTVLHQQAVELQMQEPYAGSAPRRAWAFPTHVNPFRWKGVVETGTAWAVQDVVLGQPVRGDQSRVLYKAEASPAIEAARRDPLVATFLRFSQTPHWRVTPAPEVTGGQRVEVEDLRFGFVVTAVVDATGRVVSSTFSY